jgi:hypothetical protein
MTGRTAPLYVVCSPSRCIGKTLVSRLLTEFHVLDDRPVAAFDLADEGPQLTDYLPELATIADISDTRGQMAFFDRLIAHDDGAKIIDVSHRAFKNFYAVVQEIGFFEEARRQSIAPLILFIVDPSPKTAEAYAGLSRSCTEASLLPVRNQAKTRALTDGNALGDASKALASLDIPMLGFSLRALIDRQSFSFGEFWRATPVGLPDALDDELRDWMEEVFLQFRVLERSLVGETMLPRTAAPGLRRPRRAHRRQSADVRRPGETSRNVESILPNQRAIGIPEQVLKFAPRKIRAIIAEAIDQSGDAIVAKLQAAAGRLRTAEDRISQLETEIEQVQDRADRAETWLQVIRKEIEEKLIAPTAASGSEIEDLSP